MFCTAQNAQLDSLKNVLSKMNDDSTQVDLLNSICWTYIPIDIIKSKSYCEQSILLAEKLNYKKGLSRGNIIMSNIFYNLGNYEKSLEYNLKGLKLREEIGDEHGVAGALGNIGSIYEQMRQIDKALEYHEKSLEKFKELYNLKPNDDDAFDIGICYLSVGNIYKVKKKNERAMKTFENALIVFIKLNHKPSIASCYSEIGDVYINLNDKKNAIEYFTKALNIYTDVGDKQGISHVYYNLASVYLSLHDYEKAIQYSGKSLEVAKEIEGKDNMKSVYELLSNLYKEKKDFQKAFQYHELYSGMKDSLLNGELTKQLTEMQTKYETEKKEQEITLLNKDKELQGAQLIRQRIISWSVLAGLMVVFILSLFIFRERRKSEKLLLNILPAEVAEELKETGTSKAKHFDLVTVMFTDFKGFTQISEKLTPTELVAEIHYCFKAFDNIIHKHNIEKIKTIGDAYMCAGGLPVANTTHAVDVVNAAIEINKFMLEHLEKRKNEGKEIFEIRIGIHSGPVVAGIVGIKKFAYDIWGDTVNTASRMESSGEAGKINISGSTYDLIKNNFTCVHRGKIEAKNKGEVDMYFVN